MFFVCFEPKWKCASVVNPKAEIFRAVGIQPQMQHCYNYRQKKIEHKLSFTYLRNGSSTWTLLRFSFSFKSMIFLSGRVARVHPAQSLVNSYLAVCQQPLSKCNQILVKKIELSMKSIIAIGLWSECVTQNPLILQSLLSWRLQQEVKQMDIAEWQSLKECRMI